MAELGREWEAVFARLLRAARPLDALDAARADAALSPTTRERLEQLDDDGFELSAQLVAKLRFERLIQGSPVSRAWFEEDPRAFTEAFRTYHVTQPCTARFPSEEGAHFERWRSER